MKTVTIRFKSEFAKAPESAAVTESKREALINLAHALEVQRLPVMPLQQAKVKSVQSGDTLVLVSVNNPRQERILSLAYTTGPRMRKEGDEPFAFESRDYLRTLTVGKIIQFQVLFDTPNPHSPTGKREHGRVSLSTGENLPEAAIAEGWLRLKEDASRREETEDAQALLEKLRVAETKAKAEEKGIWGKTPPPIEMLKEVEDPKAFVEEMKGESIDTIVERVFSGDRLVVRMLISAQKHVQTILLIAGIRAPSTKRVNASDGKEQAGEPLGEEAQLFVETRLLQRLVKVELLGVTGPSNQLVGIVKHPNGSIANFVLEAGLARCSDHHSTMLGPEMAKLREAERNAKTKRLGVFQGHTGTKNTGTGNVEAVVSRIQSGDAIYLRNKAGGEKRVNLSSVRQPKPTDPKQASYAPEAKEFLRKRLIGKHVRVTVDGKRPPQDGFDEREMATITFNEKNVGLLMVENGYASVIRHRRDDEDRSPIYDELLAAEEQAQKDQKGMWSGKPPKERVFEDVSVSVAKARPILTLLQRRKRVPAVVDFVKSGARFTVLIPRESSKITLVLGGIRAPRTARNASETSEPFGQEAYDLANRRCLQRDVEIDVDDIDKVGGFIGTLWVGRENFAKILLEEGFASVHTYSAEKSSHGRELIEAERRAKEARRGLWRNWDPSQDKDAVAEFIDSQKTNDDNGKVPPKVKDYRDVMVTHIDPTGKLKIQQIGPGTAKLEKLMNDFATHHSIKANATPLPTPPKTGDYVSAQFSEDGAWYRARIRSNDRDAKEAEIVFIDYGNAEKTLWSKLRPLAPQFNTSVLKPQAIDAILSFVQFPASPDYTADAITGIHRLTENKQLVAAVDNEAEGSLYITLYDPALSSKPLESYNADMVAEGLVLVPKKLRAWETRSEEVVKVLRQKQEEALRERRGMFEYGDLTGEEE